MQAEQQPRRREGGDRAGGPLASRGCFTRVARSPSPRRPASPRSAPRGHPTPSPSPKQILSTSSLGGGGELDPSPFKPPTPPSPPSLHPPPPPSNLPMRLSLPPPPSPLLSSAPLTLYIRSLATSPPKPSKPTSSLPLSPARSHTHSLSLGRNTPRSRPKPTRL